MGQALIFRDSRPIGFPTYTKAENGNPEAVWGGVVHLGGGSRLIKP